MEVLFIRHGQTRANQLHRHQPDDEPLATAGIEHTQALLPALTAWRPTHIISSPLARAHATAMLIAKHVQLPLESSDLFRELRRPRSIQGTSHYSMATVRYIWRWFYQLDSAYDDLARGESYGALQQRVWQARQFLESRYPADARVIVVSHSVFINFFVEHVCRQEHLSFWRAVPRFIRILTLDNGNATLLRYESTADNTCPWTVLATDTPVEKLT